MYPSFRIVGPFISIEFQIFRVWISAEFRLILGLILGFYCFSFRQVFGSGFWHFADKMLGARCLAF